VTQPADERQVCAEVRAALALIRRHQPAAVVLRLFFRGWSFRELARWYRLPGLLVEDVVRLGTRRAGA
jgi:hypothetical protein